MDKHVSQKIDWVMVESQGSRFYKLSPKEGINIFFTTKSTFSSSENGSISFPEQVRTLGLSDSIVTMIQTHSDTVVSVDSPQEVHADACFTTSSGIALVVKVADCVPIFLWSEVTKLIGVVHAGWRGTLSKIVLRFLETVEETSKVPPHMIKYSLGPSIGNCCYKVGRDVIEAYTRLWPESKNFFEKKRGNTYLDLRAANRHLLNSAGALEAKSLNLCTHCESNRFYSYRRDSGRGRNIGIIVMGGTKALT
jgi:YfiH family protein